MVSRKDLIIKAFSEMNLSLLEVILNDKNTYHDVSKAEFLKGIDSVFGDFKNSRDVILTPINGKCNSTSCPNKQCLGISFVGNNSKNHLDLIFEESENDIINIYDCVHFKIDNQNFKINNLISLNVSDDDSAPF